MSSVSSLSVYDGRTCVGFILNRGKLGFEAFTADQRLVGVFKTAREAANAIPLTPGGER
jgi:hypothetical protein